MFRKRLTNNITYTRRDCFSMNERCVLVPIEPVCWVAASSLFSDYLLDKLYDTVCMGQYLMLLIDGSAEEAGSIIEDIMAIVQESYDAAHR